MDFPIWVLFLFAILIGDVLPTTAQEKFWGYNCGETGNYTEGSAYKKDLDDALYSISINITNNGFGFYNSTSGRVNAVALCRGDLLPDACRRCVADATDELRINVCPNQMEAVGWYDKCSLWYSDRNMEKETDVQAPAWSVYSVSDSDYDQWNKTLANLIGRLRQETAGGDQLRKYASGNLTAPGLAIIYSVMQCTPSLSSNECDDCLDGIIKYFNRSLGVGFHRLSCFIRYETYPFFNSTWYPAPPPLDHWHDAPPPSAEQFPATPLSGECFLRRIIIAPILATALAIIVFGVFIFRRRLKQKGKGPMLPEFKAASKGSSPDGSKHGDTGEMNSFDLSTIQVATNNFSIQNKLGQGGFGPVYRGTLENGKEIAVKRLSSNSGQGLVEFKTEVELIIKLQHKNLVRLLGYCVKDNERLLIYEFMANNSLETFLFDPNKCRELDWPKRAGIISGIAKGLRYLHEDSRLKIIHRDMKAGNVLLDDDMNSKISDFGTARIFGGKQMEANTVRIVGTYGYMAPEYAMEGLFSTKSDVYGFGVLLLEIVSGQRNSQFCYKDQPQSLISTAYRLWKENKGEQLIDGRLTLNFPVTEALRWINIALLCVQEDPQDRPTMSNIVFMLEGQWSTNLPVPSEPPLSYARFVAEFEQSTSTVDSTTRPLIDLSYSNTSSH
ncbi:hypothetical protein OSB04_002391 [Centaurea solstitialis]|uniref:non-specific serine/threonine protein kinase n=1 Tax=Centaurea solstitialis TaxID=347529 RepID=A0AA38U4M5_9ASTR|nr:hypothetical protein OSB04_002391 [Centaurea solstitialis]